MEKKDSIHIDYGSHPAWILWRNEMLLANRDRLYILTELAEIDYDYMEKNDVLEDATIHQQLKIPEVIEEIALEEEKRENIFTWHF